MRDWSPADAAGLRLSLRVRAISRCVKGVYDSGDTTFPKEPT